MKIVTPQDELLIDQIMSDLVETIHEITLKLLKALKDEQYLIAAQHRDTINMITRNASDLMFAITGIQMLDKMKEQVEFIKQSIEANYENIIQNRKELIK